MSDTQSALLIVALVVALLLALLGGNNDRPTPLGDREAGLPALAG